MVSIAHWLDTFTCSKYAERFERSGLQNINTVSQITPAQLQSLGVANNDIYTIMENVLLLKQSMKTLNTPKAYDFSSEPPTPAVRSRTASPAINPLNRTMSQNPASYSPGPNVSTPPASSGPSPDRILPGPPTFDTPPAYHRANSYPNPVNPNTFFDISPSSSTSSPHRSASIDALPPPLPPPPSMDGTQFSDYPPQPQPPPSFPPHQFQPPGMMYRGPTPLPPGGYYNPPQPRFYSPDQQQQHQQQQYMYANQRMMMHPHQAQQHPPWTGHRPAMPPQPMHYHPYEHHQFRMAPAQQFYQPNHPMMSDQNSMFMGQPPPPLSSQQPQAQHPTNINPSTSSKLSPTGEPHPHPLQSLERLVLLPESQVIDPKSVVNEIHDPQSPFSESLSPFSTLSPKNSVSNPTIVSNLLTNDKSIHDSHAKATSAGLKRSSTHDERNDLNKKNRLSTTTDLNTGDSIINNHPVVTSLLTRGLSNSPSQAPLPSIKSLQQKHNPSFLQQQQQQQMIFSQTQPDPQQFVDGLLDGEMENEIESMEQNYEELMARLRSTIDTISKDKKFVNAKAKILPSQLDGIVETTGVTPKSSNRTSRKRDLSTSSERGASNSENRSSSPQRAQLNKSSSDSTYSSPNDREKKRNGSSLHSHQQTAKRRLSENNIELNHSTNGHRSSSQMTKLQKPKVIQSSSQSNHEDDDDESSSSAASLKNKVTTNDVSSKPIREAKKRSLIYTGNTREFLETAIACGLIDANGDEEDDNEYVPPGGRVNMRPRRPSSPSSSSSDAEEESNKGSEDESGPEGEQSDVEEAESDGGEDDDDDDDHEVEEEVEMEQEEEDLEKNSGDEMVINAEPSESGINWNVRNRPRRQTHLIRFDAISKQDEQRFFGELQAQVPELAAYLDDNSDEEYEVNEKELSDEQPKTSRKTSTTAKKSRRSQPSKDSSEQDEETVEIIKKFRHVSVPSERKPRRRSRPNESTTISAKNRSDELYVILDADAPRTILSGSQLDSTKTTKKSSTIQAFEFDRRQMKISAVEDAKAPWRCLFCWKEPYEQYLGPLFGPFILSDQCQTYLTTNKQLAKHYRKLKEIWLHRDCALWNNHIQMNPSTGELMHVSDACSAYLEITCSGCQLPGAALACRYRNCKIRYHYPCVKTTVNTRLVEENYSVYCPKHNQMNINKSKANRRKTTTSVNDSQESSMA